jgi:nitrogen regulatory protein PII 1
MKMVRAIVRPEKVEDVVEALEKEEVIALTKVDVFGRGKQKGIQVGSSIYDELPKVMLMIVVENEEAEKVIEVIENNARTGNIGDGKIFITAVNQAYTIRTGEKGL